MADPNKFNVPAPLRTGGVLNTGDAGPNVRLWQELLAWKGFAIEVTGQFSPKTKTATTVAQTWAGVNATGAVDAATWRAVRDKKPTRHPLTTARSLLGLTKVIDARNGRNGFPVHATKRYDNRRSNQIKAKLGHHTGGPGSFRSDAVYHVTSDYLDKGGAPAIGYTLGVDRDGALFVFNDWQKVAWHCDGGHNTDTLGIVLRGNSDTQGFSMAQRRTLKKIWLQLEAGTFKPFGGEAAWPRLQRSTTHQHVNATDCPGVAGEQYYRSVSRAFTTSV